MNTTITKSDITLEKWTRDSNYIGETFYTYYRGASQTRDSEVLEQANFKACLDRLGGENEETGVIIVRFSHWACGWAETILVHEDSDKSVQLLQDIKEELESYPVLDDDLYNNMINDYQYECYELMESDIFEDLNLERDIKTGDVINRIDKLHMPYYEFKHMVTGLMDNEGTIYDYLSSAQEEWERDACIDLTIDDDLNALIEKELLEAISYGKRSYIEKGIMEEVYELLMLRGKDDPTTRLTFLIDLKGFNIPVLQKIKDKLLNPDQAIEVNNVHQQMAFAA